MKKYIVSATLITALISFPIGWYLGSFLDLSTYFSKNELISPMIKKIPKRLPLLKYSIENLASYPFQSSLIAIENILEVTPQFSNFLFSYHTLDKLMTGHLHLPPTPQPQDGYPVIVMLRGFVAKEDYQTGIGTQAAAAVLAENGYLTLAPDFFGYGGSDAKTDNSWEDRFQKPISVIELIKTIENNPQIKIQNQVIKLDPSQIGIWAHSNGGQVALTALEALQKPIPTTLWAPVTTPFPYSILFFSDEHDDEGKEMRAWLSQFEEDYDVLEFSLTQHLNKLTGPIQLHQGTADDAVPVSWSDEFVQRIKMENKQRDEASASSEIIIEYYKYPGADHNLKPSWSEVVKKDLEFFEKNISN